MNNKLIFIFLAIVFITFISCGDKETAKPSIKIENFLITDYLGNAIGVYQRQDSDWTFLNKLNASELELFNFNTPYNLDNTAAADVGAGIIAFPNPCTTTQQYFFSAADSVLMKVVIVDERLTPLLRTSVKSKGGTKLTVKLDSTVFTLGNAYRVYYSFSAKGAENFKTGFGDIKICDSPTWDFFSCFE